MLTGRTLLLADDSLTIRKVVSLTFDDEGMEVMTVGSGAEALSKLNESLPDIILADVFMPEPNGYELCERIKRDERTRHIPVMLLVGTFEPFNEAEARRVGADEVLTKPFQSIRELVNKVGGLLGGHGDDKSAQQADRESDTRGEDDVTRDLSPYATDAQAAAPTDAAAAAAEQQTTPADAFNDFDMDDATIQTTPAAAFDAPTLDAANVFSEIREEEQFSDRAETEEAFVLAPDDDNLTEQTPAATAAPSSLYMNSNTSSHTGENESSAPSSQTNASSFDAHVARAAEADDALLELGEIAPARAATDEADDFILDIGDDDDDMFADQAATAPDNSVAELDMLFAENAPLADERKFFAEPEVFERDEPEPFAAAPAASIEELEAAQTAEAAFAGASEFELSGATAEAPAAFVEAESEHDSAEDMPAMLEQTLAMESVAHSDFESPEAFAAAPAGVVSDDEPALASDESSPVAFEESAMGAFEESAAGGVAAVEQSASAAVAPAEPSPEHSSGRSSAPEAQASALSAEMLDEVVRRVVAHMSEQVVREIAWEVVPDLAERLIKQRLEEENSRK